MIKRNGRCEWRRAQESGTEQCGNATTAQKSKRREKRSMAQIAPCISQVCLCEHQCFALCYKNINCIYSCGMCVFCWAFLSCFLQSLERVFSMRFYPCYRRRQMCMLCVFALLSLVHFVCVCVLAALFSWRSICDCGRCVLARNKTFSVDTHRRHGSAGCKPFTQN